MPLTVRSFRLLSQSSNGSWDGFHVTDGGIVNDRLSSIQMATSFRFHPCCVFSHNGVGDSISIFGQMRTDPRSCCEGQSIL